MEKLQYEDEGSGPDKQKENSSTKELLSSILSLSVKVESLATKLDEIDKKIENLSTIRSRRILTKSDVEIEEISDLEENYLTPNEIYAENPAIQTTLVKLISFRIATALEISKITKKERAVESFYLNDLWNRNKIRKLRIGRNIYFYTGKSNEIMPFKNSIIKPEWRIALISVIRELATFETNKKVRIKNVLKNYKNCMQPDSLTEDKDISKQEDDVIPVEEGSEYRQELLAILKEIEENTSLLKVDLENDKIEFIASEWLRLA